MNVVPFSEFRVNCNRSLMFVNNSPYDGQSQSGALLILCAVERIEDFGKIFVGDSATGISDLNLDIFFAI